jgi:outer membrane protein assembly factor BamE (lipoprotein component of BamABCDE complex)
LLARALAPLLLAALSACVAHVPREVMPGMPAQEVRERLGAPMAPRELPDQAAYWDYSREPYAYYRVSFGADGRVREVRNLFTEDNFRKIQPGMTAAEVETLVGIPTGYGGKRQYGDGTRSWTYRYHDLGIAKLLHVVFDPAERVLWHYSEWDPSKYSRGDGTRSSRRR